MSTITVGQENSTAIESTDFTDETAFIGQPTPVATGATADRQ